MHLFHQNSSIRTGSISIKWGLFKGKVSDMQFDNKNIMSHLFYIDNLNIFGRDEKQLMQAMHTIKTFSDYISNQCATIIFIRGVRVNSYNIQLSGGSSVNNLGQDEVYKYLGIDKGEGIQYNEMKSKIIKDGLESRRDQEDGQEDEEIVNDARHAPSASTVMAYDRYVAICRPLEYHSVMTNQKVLEWILLCWLAPIFFISVLIVLTARLTLCGSTIEKLYCEIWAVAKLSCFSTTVNNVFGYTVILVYIGHGVLIYFSYFQLIRNCIKSIEGRRKFIQTCVPHLLSLINVTIAFLFDVLYSRYGSKNLPQGVRNFMALEFLLIPPILNPLIYGLNLTTVRQQVIRLFFKKKVGISK
ncbi:olfactory receptor 52E1-like [Sinocyclocheilus anshuiensis]|uniref:olfactory receptor 52E1-like n=1 Tax=Sinocyclocheilus anshuiensis TaxID=1608454 RepID=UPI0007BA9104|nr:PREDICTED: olfactory receptor 52E1-like [Sinocyclocheilus anshuiensis]